jgi:translation initiation factor 4G
VSKANECGQQMSQGTFASITEARRAAEMNTKSFSRSILNKCEDEFKKQDIYSDWNSEKEDYEKMKLKLNDTERNDREDVLEFRRMKIKRQMVSITWVKIDMPTMKTSNTVKDTFFHIFCSLCLSTCSWAI